ncbi:MAG: helix-turn-helix transcriptional regulator [Oscillibacter sp.]|nr:helix-turn-helix transcriptional regulator [Oscillibacter sp.]
MAAHGVIDIADKSAGIKSVRPGTVIGNEASALFDSGQRVRILRLALVIEIAVKRAHIVSDFLQRFDKFHFHTIPSECVTRYSAEIHPLIRRIFPVSGYYTQSLSICQYSKIEYVKLYAGVGQLDYRTRIRHVREDRDFTQAQIGKILNKSQQGYSHIESGRAELKIDDLIRLCRFYKVSSDYLIGLTDNPSE